MRRDALGAVLECKAELLLRYARALSALQAWTLLSIFVSTIAGVHCPLGDRPAGHLAPLLLHLLLGNAAAALTLFTSSPKGHWSLAPAVARPPAAAQLGCAAQLNRVTPTPPRLIACIAGLVLEPLPVGAWAMLAVTTAVATKTLTFAQVRGV